MLNYVINYSAAPGSIFCDNLVLIHGYLPAMYWWMRLRVFKYGHPISCFELMQEMAEKDIMQFKNDFFYYHVMVNFVSAIGFGKMNNYEIWDGREHKQDNMWVLDFPDMIYKFGLSQRVEAERFLLHVLRVGCSEFDYHLQKLFVSFPSCDIITKRGEGYGEQNMDIR